MGGFFYCRKHRKHRVEKGQRKEEANDWNNPVIDVA
jgi:hypothetical protein